MNVVSAFTGIGGFDLAFQRAGATITLQIENDPRCVELLSQRFPEVPRHGDITTIDDITGGGAYGSPDILVGGFP